MSWLFWWAADAFNQPDTRGCLLKFALLMGLVALAMTIYCFVMDI